MIFKPSNRHRFGLGTSECECENSSRWTILSSSLFFSHFDFVSFLFVFKRWLIAHYFAVEHSTACRSHSYRNCERAKWKKEIKLLSPFSKLLFMFELCNRRFLCSDIVCVWAQRQLNWFKIPISAFNYRPEVNEESEKKMNHLNFTRMRKQRKWRHQSVKPKPKTKTK